MTQTFLTSPTGSNQTFNKPVDWNDAANTVECIGGGASGGSGQRSFTSTGGGGGAWSKFTNFVFTGGSATYQIATGGAGVQGAVGASAGTNGNNGGNTWFDGTTFAGASVGAEGGSGGLTHSTASTLAGGAGGLAANRPNTANTVGNNGGNGGAFTGSFSGTLARGGGGAGGPNGAGNQGVDGTSVQNTNGGSGDAGSGGAGGTGAATGSDTAGGNGTEYDASHGSGGGSGSTTAAVNALVTGKNGGLYGGASGGVCNAGAGGNASTRALTGNGQQGLIVITYTPVAVQQPFNQEDWPVNLGYPKLPQSTTASYNKNLIAQDKFPPGEARIELTVKAYPEPNNTRTWTWFNLTLIPPNNPPPQIVTDRPILGTVQLVRSWEWRYNLNLIAQDSFPPGEARTDLTPKPYPEPATRTWAWWYNLNLTGKDRLPPGAEFSDRPPLGPIQPIRSWEWRYNLNLIAQDALPVGAERFELPPKDYLRGPPSWTWNYNLNLIGLDALPVGEQTYVLPISPLYPVSLRTWLNSTVPQVTAAPFNQEDWPLNLGPSKLPQSWAASYNLNLIAQDQLPVGGRITDLTPTGYVYPSQLRTWLNVLDLAAITVVVFPYNQTDWPVPKGPIQPLRSWSWSYNLNLIGQDAFPTGAKFTDLWPRPYPEPATRTWTAWYNLNLIAQDKFPSGKIFFDRPPLGPIQPDRNFGASYNLNLIGQDIVPGKKSIDLTVKAYQQPAPSWTWNYNLNLIGQDQLPTGNQRTDLTPPGYIYPIQLRTWIDRFDLPLTTVAGTIPYLEFNWPNPNRGPQQPDRFYSWNYNLNLIAKDALPVGKNVTDLTPRPHTEPRQRSWVSFFPNVLRGQDAMVAGDQLTDLPPRDFQRPIQLRTFTGSYNLNLIGKDKLPVGADIYDTPNAWAFNLLQRYYNRSFDSGHNIELFPPPPPAVRPTFVTDWPLAGGWAARFYQPDRGFASRQNPNLQPPSPVVPPKPERQFIPGIEWQFYDRMREKNPIGWR